MGGWVVKSGEKKREKKQKERYENIIRFSQSGVVLLSNVQNVEENNKKNFLENGW